VLDAEFLAWLQMMTELAQRHFEAALAAEQDAQGKTSLLCRVSMQKAFSNPCGPQKEPRFENQHDTGNRQRC
jgi:hypothetical protein